MILTVMHLVLISGGFLGFVIGLWVGALRPWWVLNEFGMKLTERDYQEYQKRKP